MIDENIVKVDFLKNKKQTITPYSHFNDPVYDSNVELRKLFIKLWNNATFSSRYNNVEWEKMIEMLGKRGINI